MKRLIIDLDGTITLSAHDGYANALPNLAVVAQLHDYRADGFEIVIHTSRNVRTFGGDIGKINAHTLPVILAWLAKHAVPYDAIHVGKPWCGHEGFYVDDRAIRPSEFLRYPLPAIQALLATEAGSERTGD
jgi:capsule biosynthesis phosphatase